MPERPSQSFPLSNFIMFAVLSMLILTGYPALMSYLNPRPAQVPEAVDKAQQAEKDKAAKDNAKDKQAKDKDKNKDKAKDAKPQAERPEAVAAKPGAKNEAKEAPAAKPQEGKEPDKIARQWISLGSADPQDPYRMLVTLGNRGASLARIELSSPRYRDLEDRTGYLGHLVMDEETVGRGCGVQVVGHGTPAYQAGVKAGDRIVMVNKQAVTDNTSFEAALSKTRPGQTAELTVLRDGKELALAVKLIRRPLEVVRPEPKMPTAFGSERRHFDPIDLAEDCPLSLLSTLQQIDDEKIPEDDDPTKVDLDRELKGIHLRTANWTVVEHDQTHAVFSTALPKQDLEIVKTYRLAEVAKDAHENADARAYHLDVTLEVRNKGAKARVVAYRLDGPNGLPHEGAWYATKVSRGGSGLRDIVYQHLNSGAAQVNCTDLADAGSKQLTVDEQPFRFLGVDAQYFSAVMLDLPPELDRAVALRVGEVNPQQKTTTNTSFRIISKPLTIEPGKAISHTYEMFTGPKKPALLATYELGNLLYYGWFGWVAEPMTKTLHFFYFVVRNYGLAIILLTVLVRLCMFPLSRKQALNAQKMAELQPEIKRIQEKYKKDMEGRTKAQQDLFRKHNYNPLGGCLVLFIQLPIFIGLYRSLQVDVELRDAPLITEAIRWCSNLAAPDMLFNWSAMMPKWINDGVGFLGLGPFFNLLPLLTIVMFIWQQKMFMPPPADEQAALQQKMMNFMMVFMGILFYKVASGLCIYFIASSLWGIGERKFLPKKKTGDDPGELSTRSPWSSDKPGDGGRKNKKRGKK